MLDSLAQWSYQFFRAENLWANRDYIWDEKNYKSVVSNNMALLKKK